MVYVLARGTQANKAPEIGYNHEYENSDSSF
jgi:hypothetical protein